MKEYTDHIKLDFKAANQSFEQKRTRAKQGYRLRESFKQMCKNPLRIIPVALLVAAFIIVWYKKDNYIELLTTDPLLLPIASFTAAVAVAFIFILLLTELLTLLGKPHDAKAIDDDIAVVLTKSEQDYYRRPFLISRTSVTGSDAEVYVFWSRWVSCEKWRENETAIFDALDVHRKEPIRYGGKNGKNRRIIELCVGKGANPPDRGTLNDDEL